MQTSMYPHRTALVKTYGAKLRGGPPLCTADKAGRKKAFVFLVQKPLLREAKVLLVAWGFSVPWFGGSRKPPSGRNPYLVGEGAGIRTLNLGLKRPLLCR